MDIIPFEFVSVKTEVEEQLNVSVKEETSSISLSVNAEATVQTVLAIEQPLLSSCGHDDFKSMKNFFGTPENPHKCETKFTETEFIYQDGEYNDVTVCNLFEGPIGFGGETPVAQTGLQTFHYICPTCTDYVGNSVIELESHRKEIHANPHWCNICKKCFRTKEILGSHMMIHIRHPCPSCPQEFQHPKDMEEHEKEHLQQKKSQCVQKTSRKRKSLKQQTHTEGCAPSPPRTKMPSQRKNVPQTHQTKLNEMPVMHSCTMCEKVYTQRHNLVSHLCNYHSMAKCTKCSKMYTQRHNLISHMRKHHPGVPPPKKVWEWRYVGKRR